MPELLSAKQARRIALSSGTSPFAPVGGGAEGALDAIRGAGFLQIDTIGVVERAHLHVLRTRVPELAEDPLPSLEGVAGDGRQRAVVEYWAHAAAWIPIEDWRFCLPRRERIRRDGHEWFKVEAAAVAHVLERIRAEGPLMARDFTEKLEGRKGWWDWKPAKVALEFLFHSGTLVSVTRRGFQKVYDLAERALPRSLDLREPSPAELARWHVDRAADAYGIFSKDEATYQRRDGVEFVAAALSERVEAGTLTQIRIEGLEGRAYYARPETLTAADEGPLTTSGPGAVAPESGSEWEAAILSPFDPGIIDRKRLKRLFREDYTLECYLPAEKRAFGYFALPLLARGPDGDGFVCGKADCKLERDAAVLRVKRLALAIPDYASGANARSLSSAVTRSFVRFAAGLKATRVEVERFDADDRRLRETAARDFRKAGFLLG